MIYDLGNKSLTQDYNIENPVPIREQDFKGIKMGEYKEVEDKIFKFEKEGDFIEGEFINREIGQVYGNEVYKIKNSEEVFVVFSTAIMLSKMSSIKIGQKIKIIFSGIKKNKKQGLNDIKLFDVFYK